MARPTVGVTTERLYARLPEFYRDADAPLDYPLLRYESLVADQASELEVIADRLDTDLADPLLADDGWLDWLAQAVGVRLNPAMTPAERRDAVAYSPNGWRAGTRQAVADAARTALTGTKYAKVYDHSNTDVGGGTLWDVLVVTRAEETPDASLVLAAIVTKGAKPAGVVLYHRVYSATWTTWETTMPTWNAIEAVGSWNNLQLQGL